MENSTDAKPVTDNRAVNVYIAAVCFSLAMGHSVFPLPPALGSGP